MVVEHLLLPQDTIPTRYQAPFFGHTSGPPESPCRADRRATLRNWAQGSSAPPQLLTLHQEPKKQLTLQEPLCNARGATLEIPIPGSLKEADFCPAISTPTTLLQGQFLAWLFCSVPCSVYPPSLALPWSLGALPREGLRLRAL